MTNTNDKQKNTEINKQYIIVVSALTFVLPIICTVSEILIIKGKILSFDLIGKWFIFSAVGLRLFIAGIKQTTDPAFTSKEIFHIDNPDCFPIVRELGFANLCFGLIAIVSLCLPNWRLSAFGSGLYYGIAGLQHLLKRHAGINEKYALITDMLIFVFLLVYFCKGI